MRLLNEILTFIVANKASLAILILSFGGIFKFIEWLQSVLSSKRSEEFKNYHDLIKRLVHCPENEAMRVDMQIAVAFELRNFPRYFAVTRRIIKGLIATWSPKGERNERLCAELQETMNYINRNFIKRLIIRLKERLF